MLISNGRNAVSAHLRIDPRLVIGLGWKTRCDLQVRYDHIFAAINDHPLSLFTYFNYRFDDFVRPGYPNHELSGGVGLALHLAYRQP